MIVTFHSLVVVLHVLSLLPQSRAKIEWYDEDEAVRWGRECGYSGNNIKTVASVSNGCSLECLIELECTHFTWTSLSGTCWLHKGGEDNEATAGVCAVYKDFCGGICGYVPARLTLTWTDVDKVRWAPGCDYPGYDLTNMTLISNNCGGTCVSVPDCTHFVWTKDGSGTCWLKKGGAGNQFTAVKGRDAVCGYVKDRVDPFFSP